MPRVTAASCGESVSAYSAEVEFSLFPTYKSDRRSGIHTKVYTSDPWSLIGSLVASCECDTVRTLALSYFRQAKAFYQSSVQTDTEAAKPLLLYYSYLNLVKSYLAYTEHIDSSSRISHGLSDRGNRDADISQASVSPIVTHGTIGAYQLFCEHICGETTTREAPYPVHSLLASTLVGHRLWCDASNSQEHFLRIHQIRVLHNPTDKKLWVRMGVKKSVLSRIGIARKTVLANGLSSDWTNVECGNKEWNGLCSWESKKIDYTARPIDRLENLIECIRPTVYRTHTISDPFRLYYLCAFNGGERISLLKTRYLLMYFLGSVVRYHPHDFEEYLTGKYGSFLTQYLAAEPSQFVFELACYFTKREVVSVGLV